MSEAIEGQKIRESNIKIAEFMGAVYANDDPDNFPNGYWIGGDVPEILPQHFAYDYSWDWLMPVVEKIESIGLFEVCMRQFMVQIRNNNPFQMLKITTQVVNKEQDKLTATYKAVVAFLDWFEKVEVKRIDFSENSQKEPA